MSRIETVREKLLQAFAPELLEVDNESHKHSVPPGSETHLRVRVVSRAFEGQVRVSRHRRVNALLAGELASGLHALAIEALTPAEWERSGARQVSPACLGGGKLGGAKPEAGEEAPG